MTYLLTEIALEMLGYKFYDIDGVPGPINFSKNEAVPHDTQYENEPNLADILHRESLQVPNQEKTCTTGKSIPQQDTDKKRSTAQVLSQLLDAEFKKTCKEILQRKDIYPVVNSALCSRIDKQRGVIELRKAFIEEEMLNLEKEVHAMKEFTNIVEAVCKDINPIAYKHYINTFDKK